MGADYYITGFRKMGAEFDKMMDVKKFCDEKGVSYPQEVKDFFDGWEQETEETIRAEMATIEIPKQEITDDGIFGWEINAADIPEDCEKIRFWVGY